VLCVSNYSENVNRISYSSPFFSPLAARMRRYSIFIGC
jgi:hypothetical protein